MPLHNIDFSASPRRLDPSRGWLFALILLLFLLPATLQREPWKMEDAIHFGVVWRAIGSGDWIHFHLSQSTLAEPPLYYWLAGLTHQIFGGLFSPPAAIRLATPIFVVIALAALLMTARRFYGPRMPGAAPLALIGCLGLLIGSHDIQPLTATLAALAVFLLGISRSDSPIIATPLIALGVGGAMLASGLQLLPILLLTLAITQIRPRRSSLIAVVLGPILGGALLLLWLGALFQIAPKVALNWLAYQGFMLTPGKGSLGALWKELVTLSWFAWPAWPLAAYALWMRRHRLGEDAYRVPMTMTLATLAVLGISGDVHQPWLMLTLPAVALLAVPGLEVLRRGGESLLDWFGRMTIGVLLLILLFGYSAMMFGWPEKWAAKSARWAPGFVGVIEPFAVILALASIAGWLWFCFRQPRSPLKSLFAWSGGLTTFWVVIVALYLPWFDHQRSFRDVSQSVAAHLPANACVLAISMGEAQFSVFDYYLKPPLYRRPPPGSECRFALVQGNPAVEVAPQGQWTRVWEGSRPGDRAERYRLYVRP